MEVYQNMVNSIRAEQGEKREQLIEQFHPYYRWGYFDGLLTEQERQEFKQKNN